MRSLVVLALFALIAVVAFHVTDSAAISKGKVKDDKKTNEDVEQLMSLLNSKKAKTGVTKTKYTKGYMKKLETKLPASSTHHRMAAKDDGLKSLMAKVKAAGLTSLLTKKSNRDDDTCSAGKVVDLESFGLIVYPVTDDHDDGADDHHDDGADDHHDDGADDHHEDEADDHHDEGADDQHDEGADDHHDEGADDHHDDGADDHHDEGADDHHDEGADDQHDEGADDHHDEGADDHHDDGADDQHDEGADDHHDDGADDHHEDGADDHHEDGADDQHDDGADDQHDEGADDHHDDGGDDHHDEGADDQHDDGADDHHEDGGDSHEDDNHDNANDARKKKIIVRFNEKKTSKSSSSSVNIKAGKNHDYKLKKVINIVQSHAAKKAATKRNKRSMLSDKKHISKGAQLTKRDGEKADSCSHDIKVSQSKLHLVVATAGANDCSDGKLNIYHGSDNSGQPFVSLCGDIEPKVFTVDSNEVFIEYDDGTNQGGFLVLWAGDDDK